jgi:hypothetical protein
MFYYVGQGFFRCREIVHGLRESERLGWEDALGSLVQEWIQKAASSGSSSGDVSICLSNLPCYASFFWLCLIIYHILQITKKFGGLIRRFLFYYRDWMAEDSQRLHKLANWLAAGRWGSSSGPPGLPLLVNMASDSQDGLVGHLRVIKLCEQSLARLGRKGAMVNFERKAAAHGSDVPMKLADEEEAAALGRSLSDAALLLRLFDAASWSFQGGSVRRIQLITKMLELGLMKVVRKHLDNLVSNGNDAGPLFQLRNQLQVFLCGVTVHALNSGIQAALDDFCVHLLTRPLLFQSLNTASRQMLESVNLWELCLSVLLRNDSYLLRKICDADGGDGSAGMLGNLVDMSIGSLSSASNQATGRFAACAIHLLNKARLAHKRQVDSGDVVMDDDDDSANAVVQRSEIEVETAAGRVKMQHVRVGRSESEVAGSRRRYFSSSHASVRNHIGAICNREYVQKLLDVVQRIPAPSWDNPSEGPGVVVTPVPNAEDRTIIAATSGLLLQLTDYLPESKADMLNALAFKPEVLGRLWDWTRCVQSPDSGRSSDEDLSLVTLFCFVYDHLLLTSDYSEFYERQYPFSLAQVRRMVSVIKNFVVPLYWSAAPTEQQLLLRSAATALLGSLLERNCYREFAPAEEWLAADRYISTVVGELDGSLAARLVDPDRDERGLEPRHQLVLERVPFVLPFALRVRILRHLVALDRRSLVDLQHQWIRCTIKRDRVVEDSYMELNKYGSELRHTIQVSFVNQEGLTEAGIDGGGLFKEFVNTLSRQAFNPSYGLFCLTTDGLLYPSPQAETAHPWQQSLDHLKLFEFLGRIVGKAIYEGILVELRLAPFFLRRMLGQALHFDDLRSLDPELHRYSSLPARLAKKFVSREVTRADTDTEY